VTRRMADSITATDIPVADPQTGQPWSLVAGYVDGRYAWSTADWGRFPGSRHVRIAVFSATNAGDVIDRETGDATADQAVDWVLMRRAAGHPAPTVYCSYYDWPNCRNAFDRRGVAQPQWWISGYPSPVDGFGHPTIPTGAVAHQFTDTPGGHWDESIVADRWPGVDPAPHVTTPWRDIVFEFVCDTSKFVRDTAGGVTDNPTVLQLVGGGYVVAATWADVKAKDKTWGGDGTGSVLGVETAAWQRYVDLDASLRARDAHITALGSAGTAGATPAEVTAIVDQAFLDHNAQLTYSKIVG